MAFTGTLNLLIHRFNSSSLHFIHLVFSSSSHVLYEELVIVSYILAVATIIGLPGTHCLAAIRNARIERGPMLESLFYVKRGLWGSAMMPFVRSTMVFYMLSVDTDI